MFDNRVSKTQFFGISLGVIALLGWFFLSLSPDTAEFFYAREFYPALAKEISLLGNILPVAGTGMVFVGFVLGFLIIPLMYFTQRPSGFEWVLPSVISIISFAGFILFLACVSFLYNHLRYSEEKLYGLDYEFTKKHYQEVAEHSVKEANRLSLLMPKDARGCTDLEFTLKTYDVLVKKEQTDFLDIRQLPALVDANTRYFRFSNVWSGMGFSGQYQPLLGQPNIAKEIPDLYKPFVIAHERAHLNGFASEAGANLLALQTLLHASMNRLRYLGLIELWRKNPPQEANAAVMADLKCIEEDWEKVERYKYDYVFRKINDLYLKASGHEDGVGSYGRGKLLGLKYYYKYFIKS
jgi:hypothetical protein